MATPPRIKSVWELAGLPDLDRLPNKERIRIFYDDEAGWNHALRLRYERKEERHPLLLNGLYGMGVDLNTQLIYNVFFRDGNMTGVSVGQEIAIKHISHLSKIKGVVTLAKGDRLIGNRQYSIPYNLILFNSIPMISVFRAPKECSTPDGALPDNPAKRITAVDKNTRAAIRAGVLHARWVWEEGIVAEEANRKGRLSTQKPERPAHIPPGTKHVRIKKKRAPGEG